MSTIYRIPVHPQPGIFETTIADVGDSVVTCLDIEEIWTRDRWNFEDVNRRVTQQMRKDGWRDHPEGMLVPPGAEGRKTGPGMARRPRKPKAST